MFSGYVKTRESPYIQVTIWVNTIPSHIDTRAILSRYKGSYMLYEDDFQMVSKIYIYTIKYPYPIGTKKNEKFRL